MSNDINFRVPGQVMTVFQGSEISINPVNYDGGSQGAVDAVASLKAATGTRQGRGISYLVQTTRAGAETIRHYCVTVGETWTDSNEEPETKADGRALLRVAARIKEALA